MIFAIQAMFVTNIVGRLLEKIVDYSTKKLATHIRLVRLNRDQHRIIQSNMLYFERF